jgi:hypothetical protein
MSRRQLVKDAIAHKPTARVPYCIDFTQPAREKFEKAAGCRSLDGFLDNDIIQVSPPWWWWDNLGPEWKATDAPASRPGVKGNGSYNEFRDRLKLLRDHSDKYILAMIYGSHFEKANGARGIENFLAEARVRPQAGLLGRHQHAEGAALWHAGRGAGGDAPRARPDVAGRRLHPLACSAASGRRADREHPGPCRGGQERIRMPNDECGAVCRV